LLSPFDVAVIGVAALLLFGPDQLPKVARKAGTLMRDLQNTSQTFIREMEKAADIGEPFSPSAWTHHEPAASDPHAADPVVHDRAEPRPAPEPFAPDPPASQPAANAWAPYDAAAEGPETYGHGAGAPPREGAPAADAVPQAAPATAPHEAPQPPEPPPDVKPPAPQAAAPGSQTDAARGSDFSI
jgi:Sec-independent protein translocase protein TatA